MKAVTTSIMIAALVATLVAGCASFQFGGQAGGQSSGSMSDSDRVWCERAGGRWRAALDVCEPPIESR